MPCVFRQQAVRAAFARKQPFQATLSTGHHHRANRHDPLRASRRRAGGRELCVGDDGLDILSRQPATVSGEMGCGAFRQLGPSVGCAARVRFRLYLDDRGEMPNIFAVWRRAAPKPRAPEPRIAAHGTGMRYYAANTPKLFQPETQTEPKYAPRAISITATHLAKNTSPGSTHRPKRSSSGIRWISVGTRNHRKSPIANHRLASKKRGGFKLAFVKSGMGIGPLALEYFGLPIVILNHATFRINDLHRIAPSSYS
jgi:hypothetical protein